MTAINAKILNERREELDEFFGELLQTYLSDAQELMAGVTKAVEAKDPAALRESAHALKSSSGYMGADRVVELAAELEERGRDNNVADVDEMAAELALELEKACTELKAELAPA